MGNLVLNTNSGSVSLVPEDGTGNVNITVPRGGFEANAIGVGQTWQDMTASRSTGVTYTNTTGKPIMVNATQADSISGDNVIQCFVNDVICARNKNYGTYDNNFISTIVPNNSSYKITLSGQQTFAVWAELR